MIPLAANSDYPKFEPNQVLTSHNLNDLFGYLDEQQRLTRTNLIGVGIVCGLQLKTGTDSDGRFITITEGCGVTSEGYMVAIPEIKCHFYNQFDAVRCKYYTKFVKVSDKTQKLPLWELKQQGDTEDQDNPFIALDTQTGFLDDKVVLIFVELLETNNKNCDPDSCDDKGIQVTVNFRPLLALKSDVDTLLISDQDSSVSGVAVQLPDIKMPRFDVESTLLLDTEDVFQAYQDVLSVTFIQSVKEKLSGAWTRLSTLLEDDFPADPFGTFEAMFAFLHNGSITPTQAINLQYVYDFFSDLLQGYDELRKNAYDVLCECLPDEDLFPRHLLLGEATGFDEGTSAYRNRFISSPVLCCCGEDARNVKTLFKRLVLLIEHFSLLEAGNNAYNRFDLPIKITPSTLGREPLSQKAIPYYYAVNEGSHPLYLSWNPEKTRNGTAEQILSYRSREYNDTDDFVKNPLKFELEPNNFLRIEGHIGQNYEKVLTELEKLKQDNRLPFEMIALSSDTRGIFDIMEALIKMDTTGGFAEALQLLLKHPACFSDLFLAMDKWINKLRCCLLELRSYFAKLPSFRQKMDVNGRALTGEGSAHVETIEELYKERMKAGTISDNYCNEILMEISANKVHHGTALVVMPYKIDKLTDSLPEHITQLDVNVLEANIEDLKNTSLQLNTMYASENVAATMTKVDMSKLRMMLEMNCLVCLILELQLLIKEFLIRLIGLMIKQKLGYYAHVNPGIEHKAGVPKGGTFIIVYHEESEKYQIDTRKETFSRMKKVYAKDGQMASAFFAGNQALLSSILLMDELVFLKQVLETQEEPNEILDKIASSINPGTVVADFYLPYLCCSDCPPAQMLVIPSPAEPNKPPVAEAGQDQIVVIDPGTPTTVTLDGKDSKDEDGTIIAYLWTQDTGPGPANIQTPTQQETVVTDLQEGPYVFRLKVTDNLNATGEDIVTITVMPPENAPPVANAGPDQTVVLTEEVDFITLDGSDSSDPDDDPLTFEWKATGGPNTPTITDPDKAVTKVTGLENGSYKFLLTVTDNKGAFSTDEVSVEVEIKEPPVKNCGSLKGIISSLAAWLDKANDSEEMKEIFAESLNQLKSYIDALDTIQDKSFEEQLMFFESPFEDFDTPGLLINWLDALFAIIMERKDLRLLALKLYRILIRLSMYIVCIKPEDYDQGSIIMSDVFEFIGSHLEEWVSMIQQGVFSKSETDVIRGIGNDMDKAQMQIENNGETDIKAQYVRFLIQSVDLINTIPE